jgi:hypothetical protein
MTRAEVPQTHVVALSGGKDSTALALRLREIEPRDYVYLCTPTGDELPEMVAHWARLEALLGQAIIRVTNRTLNEWITEFGALPNWRQRWCTRLLKIEPCIAFLKRHAPATLYVGLRADEEAREGLYGAHATYRYPLREWSWGLAEVKGYLKARGVAIPARTDCARCYGQRIPEWKGLWRRHPGIYAEAEAQEIAVGATFRSPGRDAWPADLRQLRHAFAQQIEMDFGDEDQVTACRVCQL